ncbi:DMT family transporter [Caballeronia concitans]|uniref:Multidrug DMT transporter permease n=1 Tax=Caballeronia concitans TaxID=1777133 RepID=A0A658QY21_9BURK|nr:DMT family transporter [Caballeronia concitans]SAL32562.1 multidrug DMT transporter permease [Caballeronia concitans]
MNTRALSRTHTAGDHRRGAIEMTLAMLMSGTIGWLVVSSGQSTWNVVFFRCVFGGATLVAVCAMLGFLKKRYFSWRMLAWVALGSIAIVGNWLLLFAAYSRASISMATTVYNTQPFMLVALGALVLRERISASTLAWLGVAFVGLVMVVRVEPAVLAMPGRYLEGIGYALGAAFLYAISSIITKRLKDTPPHLIAMLHVLLGIAMLAPFARFDAAPVTVGGWACLIVLGIMNTGLMYVLLYGAIQKLPTATTGALSFIYPVVAIVVDWLAFGQHLAWLQVAGAALILLAAAGVNLNWRIVPARRRVEE